MRDFFHSIHDWVKTHPLASFLLLFTAYLLWQNSRPGIARPRFAEFAPRQDSSLQSAAMPAAEQKMARIGLGNAGDGQASDDEVGRDSDAADATQNNGGGARRVITSTRLSLKVKQVQPVLQQIQEKAAELGGFMVNSNFSQPEGASSGTIRVRVPAKQLEQFLSTVRQLGVKVVSESVSGRDITEQYQDLEERLRILQKTKTKFEQILDEASQVQDMLDVQRELLRLQRQIDNLKGRKQALDQKSKLSLVTIHLATDELALPYTPDKAWRPTVVFKRATRSFISTSRSLANLVIWAGVYSPYLLLAALVWWAIKKIK
jgi:hypothetical protein